MSDGTTYYVRVVVRDNAGNEGKSAADNANGTAAITPKANTPPYNLTTSAPTGSRTTTSLTITASATDDEQSELSYSLYFNGSFKQTISETKGNNVTFDAITGLEEATLYSWYITATDGQAISNSGINSAYTNCNGPGGLKTCATCERIWNKVYS